MITLKSGEHFTYAQIDNVTSITEPGGDKRAIDWDYVSPDDDFIDWESDDGQPDESQEWYDFDPDC